MDNPTSLPGRSRGDSRSSEIAELRETVRRLHEELHALRQEVAGVVGLVSAAHAFTKLEDSITALNYTISGSMDALVDEMGPLQSLRALVPERSREELDTAQAATLRGIQEALTRPSLGTDAGLKGQSERTTTTDLFGGRQEAAG